MPTTTKADRYAILTLPNGVKHTLRFTPRPVADRGIHTYLYVDGIFAGKAQESGDPARGRMRALLAYLRIDVPQIHDTTYPAAYMAGRLAHHGATLEYTCYD